MPVLRAYQDQHGLNHLLNPLLNHSNDPCVRALVADDNETMREMVGELIAKLETFGRDELVIFRSPQYGVFGSNAAYSIDQVAREALPREETTYPPKSYRDDETGEIIEEEAYTDVQHAWSGVVIR